MKKALDGVTHAATCACKECWDKKHAVDEDKAAEGNTFLVPVNKTDLYGIYDDFRDAVNAWCVQFVPETAYIYPDGAVLEFKYTQPANTFCDYIKSRQSDRYTGIGISQWSWKVALIDVASIGASDE